MSITERFFAKVTIPDGPGCWLWTGARPGGPRRYGSFSKSGKLIRAHRFSWEHFRGAIPEGMCVLHRCDVPSCVNPEHLFLGTKYDNAMDMIRKGRQVDNRGERHAFAKLTRNTVISIRERLKLGEVQTTLAAEFRVSRTTIYNISSGRNWAESK